MVNNMNNTEQISSYNITAQIYNKQDKYKQTLLINNVIDAYSEKQAIEKFTNDMSNDYELIKIYSIENIL